MTASLKESFPSFSLSNHFFNGLLALIEFIVASPSHKNDFRIVQCVFNYGIIILTHLIVFSCKVICLNECKLIYDY